MFVVDTNLLLYAVNPDAPQHDRIRGLLNAWREGNRPWFLTWSIVYEFLRVSTHSRVFTTPLDLPAAQSWIDILLAGRSGNILVATERHSAVLAEIVKTHPTLRGNPVHDLHIATVMKEHGIEEIQTADSDFNRFKFLNVMNPLVDSSR